MAGVSEWIRIKESQRNITGQVSYLREISLSLTLSGIPRNAHRTISQARLLLRLCSTQEGVRPAYW